MRDKHLVAVTATVLIVAAAGFALTAGGEQATPPAETADRSADATSGVTLQEVSVERLQLQNTTIENVTVGQLTVDQLTAPNRTISNGTFVDAELSSLELSGVTAEELTGEPAPESPGAANATQTDTETPGATTPAAETPGDLAQDQPTPATETPGTGTENGTATTQNGTEMGEPAAQTNESDRIGSLRIARLAVEEIQADSLTFEEPGMSANESNATTPAGEGTPAENETGTPAAPGTETGTPAQPGGPAETPGEAGSPTEAGSPSDLRYQPDSPQETPDSPQQTPETTEATPSDPQETPDTTEQTPGDEAGAGEEMSIAVRTMNVTTLAVDEMVVTVAMSNTSGAAQAGPPQETPADAGGTPANETEQTPANGTAMTPANETEQTPDTGMMTADTIVPQLDVESASAERLSARLTGTYGQFYVESVDAPTEVEVGENYTVNVTVVNADDTRNTEYVGFRLGMAIPTQELVVLEPGERRSITINASAEDLAAGSQILTVETQDSTVQRTLTVTNGTEAMDTEATPGEGPTTETPAEGQTPTETETPGAGQTPTAPGTTEPANETTTPGGPA